MFLGMSCSYMVDNIYWSDTRWILPPLKPRYVFLYGRCGTMSEELADEVKSYPWTIRCSQDVAEMQCLFTSLLISSPSLVVIDIAKHSKRLPSHQLSYCLLQSYTHFSATRHVLSLTHLHPPRLPVTRPTFTFTRLRRRRALRARVSPLIYKRLFLPSAFLSSPLTPVMFACAYE
jgi:hypothetical protein